MSDEKFYLDGRENGVCLPDSQPMRVGGAAYVSPEELQRLVINRIEPSGWVLPTVSTFGLSSETETLRADLAAMKSYVQHLELVCNAWCKATMTIQSQLTELQIQVAAQAVTLRDLAKPAKASTKEFPARALRGGDGVFRG